MNVTDGKLFWKRLLFKIMFVQPAFSFRCGEINLVKLSFNLIAEAVRYPGSFMKIVI
jgi:hypothetical protein